MIRLTAGVALALTVAAPSIQDIEFAPEVGSSVTKSFVQSFELELVDHEATVKVNGEEQDAAFEMGDLTIKETETVVFTDEYLAVEDGRATKLSRTYDDLANESEQAGTGPEGEDFDSSSEGESELEGETVVFTWDDDAEEYEAEFAEDGDEDLLDGLEAGGDLTEFLPEDEVSEGDSWEVDVSAFNAIGSPGGNVKILAEGEESDGQEASEKFQENLEGEITCTFKEMREHLAVIVVQIEAESGYEEDVELPEGAPDEMEVTQSRSISFELEGELLWDTRENHAASFELEGDLEMVMENRQLMSQEGFEIDFHSVQSFEGEIKFEIAME